MKTLIRASKIILFHYSISCSRFTAISRSSISLHFHSTAAAEDYNKKRRGVTFPSSSSSSSSPVWRHHHYDDESRDIKVSVWWDFENCGVPVGVNVYKVSQRIIAALRISAIKGPVTITAFGDVSQLSRWSQEALASTGICLTHVPNSGKNSADRSLFVDLVYWVSQNPPPAHLFLISGDGDFANIIHRLRMNNYNILLASTECTSCVLCSAASIMWHWNGLVRGDCLIGKRFNYPPDGVQGSWYGHYKGPLDDPYSDMEQSTGLQGEDCSETGTDPRPRPIPKILVNRIRQIVNLYPDGLTLSELRSELGRSNAIMDKDFFGYKKFSRFLLSMPNVLKIQRHPSGDGQPLVYAVNPKAAEPNVSNMKSSTGSELNNALSEVDSSSEGQPLMDSTQLSAAEPVESNFKSSVNENEECTRTAESNGKSSPSAPQPAMKAPSLHYEEVDTKSTIGCSTSKQQHGSVVEEGFFQRKWRTWFGQRHGNSDEKNDFIPVECSNNIVNSSQDANQHVRSCICDENMDSRVIRNQLVNYISDRPGTPSSSSGISESVPEDTGHSENDEAKPVPKSSLFNQIWKWCKFWRHGDGEESSCYGSESANQATGNQFMDESGRDSKFVNQSDCLLENHQFFSKDIFWDDMESFLRTPKGSALISQSKNREQLAQELQKEGPLIVNALKPVHLLRLVDLLISRKKWIEECGAWQPFRFRLRLPDKRSCNSPSQAHGSNGLVSIFRGMTHQPSSRHLPENGRGKQDHDLRLSGHVMNGNLDDKQPKNLAELKAWLLRNCNRIENIKPEDFSTLFKSEFNRELDCGFYGCSSTESLLAECLTDDDSCNKKNKKPSSKSRLEMLADCKKLLSEILEQHPEGFNMGCFKPLFFEKYGYVLDHQMLGYPKLALLLQIMPGVKVDLNSILPSIKDHVGQKQSGEEISAFVAENSMEKAMKSDSESGNSIAFDNDHSPTTIDQDCLWEELGPVSKTGGSKLGANFGKMGSLGNSTEAEFDGKSSQENGDQVNFCESSFLDEDISDSDGESSEGESLPIDGLKDRQKKYKGDEESSLLQILDSWHRSKDGKVQSQTTIDGLVDCSRSSSNSKPSDLSASIGSENELGGTNCGRKLKSRKKYSFVSDSTSNEKEKLLDAIMGSLKKPDSRLHS